MIYSLVSKKGLEETGQTFEKAITARQFSVLAIHNLKEKINNKGLAFDEECRIYEVCNSHKAKEVLESNMEISTALPCRVSIYTEGKEVKLTTIKPTVMLDMFKSDGLENVASEIEKVVFEAMQVAAE